jgi:predicted O-methyltransferase YrrM
MRPSSSHQHDPIDYARDSDGKARRGDEGEMIQQLAKRLILGLAPDPQTFVLLETGAKGVQQAKLGVLTGWDRWTAPIARRWAAVREPGSREVLQPEACPSVDLDVDDPIAAVLAAPEFSALDDFFNTPNPTAPALVSACTQALLYALVRNLRPEHVIEIGTYRASTSQAICRALHANGHGLLHTVDPLGIRSIITLLRSWPAALRERLCYYPMSSMDFFARAVSRGWTSDLIFVDGNHDYEYALYDIASAARVVRPGGFIAIDNISQGGVIEAARDFVRDRPSWRECGHALDAAPVGTAFDLGRSTIAGTDLCVIRAPVHQIIGRRLATWGQQVVTQAQLCGIEMTVSSPATGKLYAQSVARVLEHRMSEVSSETSITLDNAIGPTRVALPWVVAPEDVPLERTIELWLSWSGDSELALTAPPRFY